MSPTIKLNFETWEDFDKWIARSTGRLIRGSQTLQEILLDKEKESNPEIIQEEIENEQ